MNDPLIQKIPYECPQGKFELRFLSYAKNGAPAIVIAVYQNGDPQGGARFPLSILEPNNSVDEYMKQGCAPVLKKFNDGNWIAKILAKNDPNYVFDAF